MSTTDDTPTRKLELDEDDLAVIRDVFDEKITPKLRRRHARTGTLSCEFAGPAYAGWILRFRSIGNDFEIIDYEYDQDGDGLDLDL
ncbi:MAG: hypothetical protein ACQET7_04980 [Thermodesulfobacteriota bacterium]